MGQLYLGDVWHMYNQYEATFVTVETETMAWLLKAEAILDALMAVGIHTHERFDEAMANAAKGAKDD